MWGALSQIRPQERRDTFVAFASLFAFMCAHALLETARDALFLARIPATQLPLVYIAVALVAVLIGTLQGGSRSRSNGRQLAAWLAFSGVATLGFWPFVDGAALWVLYALYVWSAVVVTVVLARFFILLGERFTVTQAKRLYAFIGAGSVAGAIAGSAVAGLLASNLPARHLLLVAAGVLIVSASGPMLLDRATLSLAPGGRPTGASEVRKETRQHNSWRQVAAVLAHPYARRIAVLVIIATITFTLVDFVFKSTVASVVATEQLGSFFARVYLALNILSLVAQLLLVRPLIRVLTLTGAAAVLPTLLLLGGVAVAFGAGAAVGGGVLSVLLLKGADGGLRHSLHRTVSELLYVPMSDRLRTAAKTFIDIVGQRGGQALASLAILAAVALGVDLAYFGSAIALLAALWIGLAVELRGSYIKLFRTTLSEEAERAAFDAPELDLSSLEALLKALNSSNDAEVRAALMTLAEEGRVHVIPALILYHPSPDVVVHALDIFTRSKRDDFIPITDRLLDHEYADVRAAALRARIRHAPDEALLRDKAKVNCPVVRATALIGLTAARFASLDELGPELDEIADNGSDIAKEALAQAIRHRPSPQFDGLLLRLSQADSHLVRLSVVRAMARAPSARYLPRLLAMLPIRQLRDAVRNALVKMDETAFGYLASALEDTDRDLSVRRHLPRTLMLFDPRRAAAALLRQLPRDPDGVVRYKILRALGRLVTQDPGLPLDKPILRRVTGETIARAYQLIEWRMLLVQGSKAEPKRATAAQRLLLKMLRDKETNAIERLFRLLGLLFPKEDLITIFRGLKSARADVRSSSRELLETFLSAPLDGAVLGLVDDAPDKVRLRSAGRFHHSANKNHARDYNTVLVRLLDSSGESLRSLAVYHVGELGLTGLRSQIEALDAPEQGLLAGVVKGTIDILNANRQPQPGPAE